MEERNGMTDNLPENGGRRLTERKKKKRKLGRVYSIILFLLIGVMCFSAYKIISQLIIYKKAADSYSNLQSEVISVVQATPAATKPQASGAVNPGGSQGNPGTQSGNDPAQATDPAATGESGEVVEPAAPYEGLPLLSVDFDALKNRNSDVLGWLYGQQDGWVSLPVVQGTNNSYYLHRLLDGSYNFAGTLFVDYRNKFLEDDISYIYGHHMKNDSMFGRLDDYDSYEYYQANPAFRFYMPDAVYDFYVVAAVRTTTREELFLTFQDAEQFMEKVASFRERSAYQTDVDVQYGDKLVCLYTCAYHVDDGRYFLICKAVRVG